MSSLRQYLYRRINHQWKKIYFPAATLPAHSLDCPECGLHIEVGKTRQGQEAICPRCEHTLFHIEPEPYPIVLACATAALLLMIVIHFLPLFAVQMAGIYSQLTLLEMVSWLLKAEWGFLGLVLFILTFFTPILFLIACIYVYYALLRAKKLPYLLAATRLLSRLRQWIMVDVFFVSMLVAYIKLSSVATVSFGAAFWLMPFLALLLLRTSIAVPEHWVYYQIHRHNREPFFQAANDTICCTRCLYYRPRNELNCGVCGSELFNRRPYSLTLSFHLLLAAIILYIPANFLPIMISENPMSKNISTIMNGITYMWKDGDKLIAIVIFSASVAVPTLKILSMLSLLISAKFKLLLPIEKLSLQYRITEMVGRWSMIDIFVIIIMMTSFHTNIARVTPGPAAIYFCLVVILTMLSAYFFDIRLLWDKHLSGSQNTLKD